MSHLFCCEAIQVINNVVPYSAEVTIKYYRQMATDKDYKGDGDTSGSSGLPSQCSENRHHDALQEHFYSANS